MMDFNEATKGCAKILKDLRINSGLSVNKMAEVMYVDRRTWQRYEDGESSPTVPEFLQFFTLMGESAVRAILDFLHPVYQGLSEESDIDTLRDAAAHYFKEIAPDHVVREWDYIMFADHGSNCYPQLQEFTMIDHLPLEMRTIIADLVCNLYRIAELKGELIGADHIMPDVSALVEDIEKGKKAVTNNLSAAKHYEV